MIRHANRTPGFFKIRGVNVNHAEFEDMMFRLEAVDDFQAVLETDAATGRKDLRILVEIRREAAPEIEVQPQGRVAHPAVS